MFTAQLFIASPYPCVLSLFLHSNLLFDNKYANETTIYTSLHTNFLLSLLPTTSLASYSNFRLLFKPPQSLWAFLIKTMSAARVAALRQLSLNRVIPCIIIFPWFSSILRIHFFQITIEPPQGLRANLLVAYQSKPINEDKFYSQKEGGGNGETRKTEFQRLHRTFHPRNSHPWTLQKENFNPKLYKYKFFDHKLALKCC